MSSSPSGIDCPGACVASFKIGTSVVLFQSTSGTFAGWSGACAGTGSCPVTMRAQQFVTATFSAGLTGVWTITNQQPVTKPFYPDTLWTTPLPADVGSHLYPASAAIVTNIFGGSDTNGTYSVIETEIGSSSMGNGFYYSSQADPVFRINAASRPCPPKPINCPAGKYFHLPSGARWDSGAGDENLILWDQSTDIDATPGGRLVFSYFSNSNAFAVRSIPMECRATTPAQADQQPRCQLDWYYSAVNYPFNDRFPIGDGIQSDGMAIAGNYLREQEVMQGTINHALGFDTDCLRSANGNGVADPPVFPATGNAVGCKFVDALRPLNGNLLWIDSGYNCNTLPPWQRPVCVAMQTYGGYVHATGGAGPLSINPIEGGVAHTTFDINDPMFNEPNTGGIPAWIISNSPGLSCPGGGYPKVCIGTNGIKVVEDSPTTSHKVVFSWFNMPGLITGHHLHIIDPCIPKRMAGQPGAC